MNRIRELRKQMDITQKELAKHLQVADSTLSYWELGRYEPDTEALMKLSRFFNVPIDYILNGDFQRWDISGQSKLYPNEDVMRSADLNLTVSEVSSSYSKNKTSNASNGFNDAQTAFDRVEFDGLTQDEIDKLAEYAIFIKSRRKSE